MALLDLDRKTKTAMLTLRITHALDPPCTVQERRCGRIFRRLLSLLIPFIFVHLDVVLANRPATKHDTGTASRTTCSSRKHHPAQTCFIPLAALLNLARAQVQGADTMWSTQKLEAVTYRKALWAEDIEPIADATAQGEGAAAKQRKKKQDGRIVLISTIAIIQVCTRCALPLVAGLNQVSAMGKPVSSRGRKKAHGKSRKRKAVCTLCHHKTR